MARSISNIQFLFTMEAHINPAANPLSPMDDFFLPLDFTNIAGHPHAIPMKAIEKLPTFQGNNVISASSHLSKFLKCLLSWYRDVASEHDDVYMKRFSLSLEEDACDWYINLANEPYNYWDSFRKGFMEIFGEKKEPRFLLNALHSIKRNENETMEELNKKFRGLIASMNNEFKAPDKPILVYYTNALSGEMR